MEEWYCIGCGKYYPKFQKRCDRCLEEGPPVPLMREIGNYAFYKCPHISLTEKEVELIDDD